jgi:hypothetical protein
MNCKKDCTVTLPKYAALERVLKLSSSYKLGCTHLENKEESLVLVAFAKFREKRLLPSSCLSVRPHGSAPFPVDCFS